MREDLGPLTIAEEETLRRILQGVGHEIYACGHVRPKNRGEGYPQHHGCDLPVAYINPGHLYLYNVQEPFFEEIHRELRQIYRDVTSGVRSVG